MQQTQILQQTPISTSQGSISGLQPQSSSPQSRKFRSHSAVAVPERGDLSRLGSHSSLTSGNGDRSSPGITGGGGGGGSGRHPIQHEWQRLARLVASPGASSSRLSRKQSMRSRCSAPNVVVWFHGMDKRCTDRNEDDLEMIYNKLRSMMPFSRLHPVLLQQLSYYGYYEDIDAGVTLFREGDKGKNWYAVLKGSLDVQVTNNSEASKDNVTLCTLGVGTAFGESVAGISIPHSATVVTNECCELLRIEQRDFKLLWDVFMMLQGSRNRHFSWFVICQSHKETLGNRWN